MNNCNREKETSLDVINTPCNLVINISDEKQSTIKEISISEETLNEDLDQETKIKNSQKINQKSKRLYWADCARIYSILAIIFLHCAGYSCEKTLLKRNDPNLKIICWYNCITRFGVPMFVLLSGTFILDPSKKFSFKKMFKHNILRLATAFAFWSTISALLNIFLYHKNEPSEFLKLFVVGEEYLWFIFMIIGCYLIAPFLRLFSDNVILARYFLGLCVFWGSFIPTLKSIFSSFELKEAQLELNTWTNRWHFHFTLEFVGYFVAGYHIVKNVNISSIYYRLLLYILGVFDVLLIGYLTYHNELKNQRYSKEFRDTCSLTVVFYTVILFIFFKHEIGRIQFSEKAVKVISKFSSLTFGMYLSHMIIKILLSKYCHIRQEEFLGIKVSSKIGCPIAWLMITMVSLLVSYSLSKIPILKNYVV